MKNILYLLVSSDRNQFKIGVTKDVYQRLVGLKNYWGDFDLGSSCIVTGANTKMEQLERSLHFMFEKWNIDTDDKFDGHTEWFDINCLEEVKRGVKRIAKLRSHNPLNMTKGIVLPENGSMSPNAWQLLSKEEKRILQEAKTNERKMEVFNGNQLRFQRFVELINNLKPYIAECRKNTKDRVQWRLVLKTALDIKDELRDLERACSFDVISGGCNLASAEKLPKNKIYYLDFSESGIKFLESHEETKEIGRSVVGILRGIESSYGIEN